MGKSVTCNYQLQIYNPKDDNYLITGAMSFKQAINTIINEAKRLNSNHGFIWGQTEIGNRKIRHYQTDFVRLDLINNGYKLTGQNIT